MMFDRLLDMLSDWGSRKAAPDIEKEENGYSDL